MKTHKIAVMPGDGIGPEIIAEGMKVLDKVQNSTISISSGQNTRTAQTST